MFFISILINIIYFLVSMMIFLKTPIYSTLCLASILLLSILLLFFSHVEFLSYVFILVYVGGIAILFLFVIIMLNLKIEDLKKDNTSLFSGTLIVFFLTLKLQSYIFLLISDNFKDFNLDLFYIQPDSANYVIQLLSNDIWTIGLVLYTEYCFSFILLGIILFICMIGVLILALSTELKV